MMTILINKHWKQFVSKKCRTIDKSHSCEFCVGPNSLILDCDKIKADENFREPINDCIAIEKDNFFYIGIVEIKGRSTSLEHTMAQLATGERIALRILKDSNIKEGYKMYKIIVAKSYPHSGASLMRMKRKLLKTSSAPLITVSCNDTFANVRKKKLFG